MCAHFLYVLVVVFCSDALREAKARYMSAFEELLILRDCPGMREVRRSCVCNTPALRPLLNAVPTIDR